MNCNYIFWIKFPYMPHLCWIATTWTWMHIKHAHHTSLSNCSDIFSSLLCSFKHILNFKRFFFFFASFKFQRGEIFEKRNCIECCCHSCIKEFLLFDNFPDWKTVTALNNLLNWGQVHMWKGVLKLKFFLNTCIFTSIKSDKKYFLEKLKQIWVGLL